MPNRIQKLASAATIGGSIVFLAMSFGGCTSGSAASDWAQTSDVLVGQKTTLAEASEGRWEQDLQSPNVEERDTRLANQPGSGPLVFTP